MVNFEVRRGSEWDRFTLALTREIPRRAKESIMQELIAGSQDIRTEMIQSMRNTPRTGKTYRRGGVTHKASAPGNPPAPDTGGLISRIIVDVRENEVEVGASLGGPKPLKYPPFLEFGAARITPTGGRSILFPRPFMLPALRKKQRGIERRVSTVLQQAIRDSLL